MQSDIQYHHIKPHVPTLSPVTGNDFVGEALADERLIKEFPNLQKWKLSTYSPGYRSLSNGRDLKGIDLTSFLDTKISTLGLQGKQTHPEVELVFNDVFFVSTGKGFILIDEALDLISFSKALPKFDPSDIDVKEVRNLGKVFYAGDRFGSENICHYLFDQIGRAVFFLNNNPNFKSSQVGLVRSNLPYNRYCLSSIIPDALALERGCIYKFDSLHMLKDSFSFMCHPARFCDPDIMSSIRKNLISNCFYSSESPKKIFLSRKNYRETRALLNEDKLVEISKRFGFKDVCLDEHSPQEQLNILSNAEFVVAPHGAALTSLCVCTKGTKVLELFNPNVGTAAFWFLSNYLDLKHFSIFGESFEGGQSWTLDESEFQQALYNILSMD